MCKKENCYKTCINKMFLLNEKLMEDAQQIVVDLKIKSSTGRPAIDFTAGLNGVYYLLKTGIQWKGIPRCFGSSSAIHRLFQKLRDSKFFELLWHKEIQEYDRIHGLKLRVQAGDCSHIRAPLGQEKTGRSPVDRSKLGTKRSIIVEENGIVLGFALGPANRHDSKLFEASLRSIPQFIAQPRYKEMHLDRAYDAKSIRTMLFNRNYVPKIAINRRNSNKNAIISPEKKRWIVESSHSWINRFRRLFVRFEKLANNHVALIKFALSINTFNKIRL